MLGPNPSTPQSRGASLPSHPSQALSPHTSVQVAWARRLSLRAMSPHGCPPPRPPSEQTRRQWLDSKRTPCLKGTCLPSPLPSCTSAPVSSVGRPSSWGQAQPAPSRPEIGTSVVRCEVPPSTKNRAPLWPSNPSSGCPLINLKTFAHGSIAHGGREVETFGRGRTG